MRIVQIPRAAVLRSCPLVADMEGSEPPEGATIIRCEGCDREIWNPPPSMVPPTSAGRIVFHACFDCAIAINESCAMGSLSKPLFYGPSEHQSN
jgi:hypothetical protein